MLSFAQALMVAVLEQAIADLRSPHAGVRWQARAWFLARDAGGDHPFSFSRICQEFRRTPSVLRARILARFAGDVEAIHEARGNPHNWATRSGIGCERSAVAANGEKAQRPSERGA